MTSRLPLLLLLALCGCAHEPQVIGFTDEVCETRIPGQIEGVATIEGRPALPAPVVETGHGRYAGRAIRHEVGGAVTLFCSRSATGTNHCVLGPFLDENYGFDRWALSTVPDLDIPARPDAPPVRVDFVFTLTQPHVSTCEDWFAK